MGKALVFILLVQAEGIGLVVQSFNGEVVRMENLTLVAFFWLWVLLLFCNDPRTLNPKPPNIQCCYLPSTDSRVQIAQMLDLDLHPQTKARNTKLLQGWFSKLGSLLGSFVLRVPYFFGDQKTLI